jgi:hypothetical protein
MDLNLLEKFQTKSMDYKDLNLAFDDFRLSSVIKKLKIPGKDRNQQDTVILQFLTSSILFFKNNIIELGETLHIETCNLLEYEHKNTNEVIYN